MKSKVMVDCQLSQADGLEMERNGLVSRKKSKNSISYNTTPLEKDRVNLQWKRITYKTEDGITILNGLCGSSNSGELTAIMGPSGSGKTSLVNILSGFVQKRVTGQIFVNGAKPELHTFRKITCYILQDDHILPHFTVRELITFASKLKIPSTVSAKERKKAVDDCIYGLGLVGQQNQLANTLSGGQRKRLSIAQEIVNNPPLIFLDEPTSGLDSSSCLQCIQLLKSLAEQGKNIICTIHQPSSRIYEIFDNLYMLSDGECIYRGPTKDLLPYLDNQGLQCPKYHSPTDFLTDIAIGLYGEWLLKLKEEIKAADCVSDNSYEETDFDDVAKDEGKRSMSTMLSRVRNEIKEILQESWEDIKSNEYDTDNFNQFRVLIKRSFLNQLRNPIHMKLKLMGSIVIGLLLGTMYYNTGNDGSKVFNTAGLMFTLMIFLIIIAQTPTVLTFPLQRTIFEREHRNGWYSTKMYYFATTLAEMPYQIICPMIVCSLLYWLSGQPPEWQRLFLFILSGIMVSLIAESVGLMIGAATDVQIGILISSAVISVSLVLSGMFLPYSYTPKYIRWLYLIFYTRYATVSISLAIYNKRPLVICKHIMCFFKDHEEMLRYFSMDGSQEFSLLILLLFFLVFRILAYLILKFKVSQLK